MTVPELLGLLALAGALAAGAGAAMGIVLGGKDLGRGLAAMMGAFYGPAAVLPAVAAGLIILVCVR